jgi:hypothetical protein
MVEEAKIPQHLLSQPSMLEPGGLPDLTTALPEWDHQLLKMHRSHLFHDVARNKLSVLRPIKRAEAPAVGQGCGVNKSTPLLSIVNYPVQTLPLFGLNIQSV